jgi:hypothetical protein
MHTLAHAVHPGTCYFSAPLLSVCTTLFPTGGNSSTQPRVLGEVQSRQLKVPCVQLSSPWKLISKLCPGPLAFDTMSASSAGAHIATHLSARDVWGASAGAC